MRAAQELSMEAQQLISAGRSDLALTAVMPGAKCLRGDGELLSSLAGELTRRAARYVARVEALATATPQDVT